MAFKKGKSGNPAGRPKGIKDKRTIYNEMLQDYAPVLIEKLVEKALEGDTQALRICMDRLLPSMKAIDHTTGGKPLPEYHKHGPQTKNN